MIKKIRHTLTQLFADGDRSSNTVPVKSDQVADKRGMNSDVLNGLLRSIVQDLDDGCLIVAHSMEVQFGNNRVAEWFGWDSKTPGQKVIDVLPDHRLIETVQLAFKDSVRVERSFLVGIKKGEKIVERYLTISASPVEVGAFPEDPDFVQLIIRDDTEHHETEQIRKDFVANASHELRTPLSIINGYLENLVDGVIHDDAMTKRALITMQKHGERIARIVEDMLTISKFESVGLSETNLLRGRRFDVATCVRDVVDRLNPLIEQKSARVTIDIPEEAREIAGDRFYWDQVFFNLIENALKENDRDQLEVSISVVKTDEGHRMEVRDNGVGIPKSHLPFVFKRFYRVAKHRGSEVKGTGLGLSIVKRAVEAHGGKIFVDSTPGISTAFTIQLPLPPVYLEGEL
ncbi:MAG: PAS domain-containing protein [Verrucomicrobiae bacterium]|nr:PAS domain-containing protein [Verrucomicrobiae bacterium]